MIRCICNGNLDRVYEETLLDETTQCPFCGITLFFTTSLDDVSYQAADALDIDRDRVEIYTSQVDTLDSEEPVFLVCCRERIF